MNAASIPRRQSDLIWSVNLVLFWAYFLFLLRAGSISAVGAVDHAPEFPSFQPHAARDYLNAVARGLQTESEATAEMDFVRARLKSQLGEKEAAEKLARQALEKQPNRAEIHSFLAGLYIQQDRLDEAAPCLRRALELKPENPGEYRRLGMVLDRLGDRSGAQEAFTQAVRRGPEDATARLLLGRLLLDTDRVKEALPHFQEAVRLDPKLAGAYYGLSQAQHRLGDADGALASRQRFQELKLAEKGELDSIHQTYQDDSAMRTIAASFHAEVAGLFVQRRQAPLAEAHLRQAIRIAPQEPRPYEMLATLMLQSGRLREARGVCEDLVRHWPDQALYRVNLGTLLLQLREFPAALSELRRAVELDPRQPLALHNLARLHLESRQNPGEALALARRLVEVQPIAPNFDLLGWASFANGDLEAARSAASQAVARDPTNTVYRERYQKLLQQANP
jgi:tetratricopeptide (TPR) repeat protein